MNLKPVVAILVSALLAGVLHAAPIKRSHKTVQDFKNASGFPNGRPGYVVDHVVPLCAGGPDEPSNMQWQEYALSKVKDSFELELCAAMKREHLVMVRTQ